MPPESTTAPVDVGTSYHLEIEELGTEGDGIGYVDDFVVIVPGASLGESTTVEIERVEDHYAMATIVEGPDQSGP
ncbi:MAG: TRAM domain-containing protein [Halodesulfurarchaeum sp.]